MQLLLLHLDMIPLYVHKYVCKESSLACSQTMFLYIPEIWSNTIFLLISSTPLTGIACASVYRPGTSDNHLKMVVFGLFLLDNSKSWRMKTKSFTISIHWIPLKLLVFWVHIGKKSASFNPASVFTMKPDAGKRKSKREVPTAGWLQIFALAGVPWKTPWTPHKMVWTKFWGAMIV